MDPRLKHIVDHYDTFKIGTDEPFPFHCVQCGKCCVHREDILLIPQDLFRMAKHLGQTPKDVVIHYCEVYTGPDSRMPLVRLLPEGEDWTAEKGLELSNENPELLLPMSGDELLQCFMWAATAEFIDRDAGTCSFDTDPAGGKYGK